MPDFPLVSIGIPTFNSAGYIIETLESVKAQGYQNIQLIVVDDCSTDNSFEVVSHWLSENDINHVHQKNAKNLGVVATCNLIFEHIRGKYFQLLGADDILYPDKTVRQLQLLEASDDSVAMTYSNVDVIDDNGKLLSDNYFGERGFNQNEMPTGKVLNRLLFENFIPSPAVLIRTACAITVLPYDEKLAFEDFDLWLKLSVKYDIAYCPGKLAAYRRRSGSLMHTKKSRYQMMASTLQCMVKYRGINKEADRLINDKIYRLTPALYRFGHPDSFKWVREMWRIKKNYKSFGYLVLSAFRIKIPFSR